MQARFLRALVLMVSLWAVTCAAWATDGLAPQVDDPDLLLWLDATDRATLTTDQQGFVSEWKSKSLRVPCAVTAQDQQRPTWVADAWAGKPAVRFDGRDDVLRNVQFQDADIAEVVLYARALLSEQVQAVSQYPQEKYAVANVTENEPRMPLDEALTALASYHWDKSRSCLVPIDELIRQHDRQALDSLETQLATLLGQDISPAAVDAITRRLAVIGTAASVPALKNLLPDQQRGAAALQALQQIPAPEAGQALLETLGSADPPQGVALIHALGARREVNAVGPLLQWMQNGEAAIAAAAGEALAQIGDHQTTDAMLTAQGVSPHALLTLATSLAAAGHGADAQRVYAHLDQVPDDSIRSAVLRGRVMLEPSQATQLLLSALRGDSVRVSGQAAQLLAHACPEDIVNAVVTEFPSLSAESQSTLLGMRWSRIPDAGRGVALQALEMDSPVTRRDSIRLLADAGRAEDVPLLARIAVKDGDVQVRTDAELALRHLAAAGADDAIREQLSSAPARERNALIRAARDRRMRGAATILMELVESPDEATRVEALTALQQLGDAASVPRLVDRLLAAETAEERTAAERAVWLCALRSADSAESVAPVIEMYQRADANQRALLLPVLGRLGGPRAAEVIDAALADAQPNVRAAAVRGLANWPDASVADRLIQLARQADVPAHRVWVLRGYVRVVTLPNARPAEQTVEMLQDAWQLATRDEERSLILQRLPAIVCTTSLEMAVGQLREPGLQAQAVLSAAQLAEALLPSDPQTARGAIEKILEVTVDPDLRMRLSRHLSSDR